MNSAMPRVQVSAWRRFALRHLRAAPWNIVLAWASSALFHAVALAALARLVPRFQNVLPTIAGERDVQSSASIVSFAGHESVEPIEPLLSQADVVVAPTHAEALGVEYRLSPTNLEDDAPASSSAAAKAELHEAIHESPTRSELDVALSDSDISKQRAMPPAESITQAAEDKPTDEQATERAAVMSSALSLPQRPQTVGFENQRPPLAVFNPPPLYPPQAAVQGIQGTVVLRLTVSAQGEVAALEVHQSSGHGMLDAAAVQTVRNWRFEPALVGAQSVPWTGRLSVRFVPR